MARDGVSESATASDVRARVRRLVRERGATAAARDLQMVRETALAVAADADVTESTLLFAARQLPAAEAKNKG